MYKYPKIWLLRMFCSAGLVDRALAWHAEDTQIKSYKRQLFFWWLQLFVLASKYMLLKCREELKLCMLLNDKHCFSNSYLLCFNFISSLLRGWLWFCLLAILTKRWFCFRWCTNYSCIEILPTPPKAKCACVKTSLNMSNKSRSICSSVREFCLSSKKIGPNGFCALLV
jgi:hypothetical protein